MVAQQLDGYGQEAYPAKDDAGNDILMCVSANGLVIRRRDWTHVSAFRYIAPRKKYFIEVYLYFINTLQLERH
jgi:hypothetical protein